MRDYYIGLALKAFVAAAAAAIVALGYQAISAEKACLDAGYPQSRVVGATVYCVSGAGVVVRLD